MSDIHVFNHRAMATHFQVRIAGEEKTYAAQTAQEAFALTDKLESHLSRFRPSSGIAQIAQLAPGEKMRLSEPPFGCLEIEKTVEWDPGGAFSVTASALQTQTSLPQWSLLAEELSIRCEGRRLE